MSKIEKKEITYHQLQQKEIPLLFGVVHFCSNVPISLYTDSVGIKNSEAVYRGALASEVTRLNSEEYLLNAKKSSIDISTIIGVSSYSSFHIMISLSQRLLLEKNVHENGDAIKFPIYRNVNAPIGSVIRSRRSVRDFKGNPLSLEDLSTILYYGDGVSGDFDFNLDKDEYGTISLGEDYMGKVRTAPSGGGLYPIYLYIVVLNVEGLNKGIYKYMPLTHSLEKIKIFDDKDLEYYFSTNNLGVEINMEKVGASIYYVYSMYENSRKYGDMALQFALIETGEIAENIHLVATAENIAVCDVGGFDKVKTEELIDLDGLTNHIVHLTLISK